MTYETCGLAPALEILAAAAAEESVTGAAQRLGIPQPTVSRVIARLARQLGTDLTVREGGIRFTRQGICWRGTRAARWTSPGRNLRGPRGRRRRPRARDPRFPAQPGPDRRARPAARLPRRAPRSDLRPGPGSSETVVTGVLAGRIDLALASPVLEHADWGSAISGGRPW